VGAVTLACHEAGPRLQVVQQLRKLGAVGGVLVAPRARDVQRRRRFAQRLDLAAQLRRLLRAPGRRSRGLARGRVHPRPTHCTCSARPT